MAFIMIKDRVVNAAAVIAEDPAGAPAEEEAADAVGASAAD